MSQNNAVNDTVNNLSTVDINKTTTTSDANSQSSTKDKKTCRKKLLIIISVVAAVVVAAVVVVVVILVTKKKDKNKKIVPEPDKKDPTTNPITQNPEPNPATTTIHEPIPGPNPATTTIHEPTPGPNPATTNPQQPTQSPNPVTTIPAGAVPLTTEFAINTNQGDLKRIKVVQTSHDQSKFNDKNIETDTTRETDYDIFILSEEDAQGEDKLYYSKMYTGAISIAQECYYTGDDKCQPKELVNISKIKEDPAKLRMLETNIDFKNIPLATCLFNITDNDFITSITCHKDFPDMKKNEMLLDLYFFRSPAIERKNKTRDNITISINDDVANNRRHIREQNGGLCNIHNNWGSHCTTDMNITMDLDGNLLKYDEVAITNIVYDEKNSFTKNKV